MSNLEETNVAAVEGGDIDDRVAEVASSSVVKRKKVTFVESSSEDEEEDDVDDAMFGQDPMGGMVEALGSMLQGEDGTSLADAVLSLRDVMLKHTSYVRSMAKSLEVIAEASIEEEEEEEYVKKRPSKKRY